MKKEMTHVIRLLAVCAVSAILVSCATGNYLRTEESSTIEMENTYSLIYYGGRFSDDRETLAILDKDDDAYKFIVIASEYDYRIEKNVPAKSALAKAEHFVRFHHTFRRSLLSRILDQRGATIGYEVKPLYFPVDVGYSDLIDTYYRIEGKTVMVRVRLRAEAEDRLFERDTPFIFRGR